VAADRLGGRPNRYKIKLKKPGVSLVYEVVDSALVVVVLAVDKRERMTAYVKAAVRSARE
jgi:mRNA interferase RelE/StbE